MKKRFYDLEAGDLYVARNNLCMLVRHVKNKMVCEHCGVEENPASIVVLDSGESLMMPSTLCPCEFAAAKDEMVEVIGNITDSKLLTMVKL